MKNILSLTVIVSLVFLAVASIARAEVPAMMHYQGFLTDEEGEPLNDTLSMTFTIYPDPDEAIVLWTETQADVIVTNGLFHVLLGSVNPIVDTVFAETERWLGITVAPDPEIVPRTRLVTVPWAFRVSTVDGASGGTISGRVGIGVADPYTKLQVETSDPIGGISSRYTGTDNVDIVAVSGVSVPADNWGFGGTFVGGYRGVNGRVYPTGSYFYYGVLGDVRGGSGHNYGVYGYASGAGTNVAVMGSASDSSGASNYGVYGYATDSLARFGVYGDAGDLTADYAGYFYGNTHTTGTSTKGSGGFKIDHPLDPENRYLYHSSVESPDMLNVYNGNVILGADGEATVKLPDYFEAVNKDFRYQLTPIGTPGPNLYISEEISENYFKIAGGESGMKVSWQVTGIRKDAFAEANRVQVEKDKPDQERGKYLHAQAHGLGKEYGVHYEEHKRIQEELKERSDREAK